MNNNNDEDSDLAKALDMSLNGASDNIRMGEEYEFNVSDNIEIEKVDLVHKNIIKKLGDHFDDDDLD